MIPVDVEELYDIFPAAAELKAFRGLEEPVFLTSGLFCTEGITIFEVSTGLVITVFDGIEEVSDLVLSGAAEGV